MAPAGSVIIPTCNRPELLRVALESLTWQTFTDFETVLVNDGEMDVTPVLSEFAGKLRITAVSHKTPRRGLSAARNTGISLSRGAWIVYLDDDDFFYKQHLEYLHRAVTESQYKVVYTDALMAIQQKIDGVYETVSRHLSISKDFDPVTLAHKNLTPVLCLIHSKKCLQRSLTFATYLGAHEDWDLWQRMARHYRFRHIPVPTAEFIRRRGAPGLSTDKENMANTWIFSRRQGMLHSALLPVYTLEERAADAARLGDASGPCRASVVLPLGNAAAFLGNSAALRALDALCATLGDAQFVIAGFGKGMPELFQRVAGRVSRSPRCVHNPEDTGRVVSANQAAALAEGEWLIFLEPGVEPCENWLDLLLDAARENPSAAVLGGAVQNPRTGLFAGGVISGKGELHFNRLPKDNPPDALLPVDCLSSLCLMVRREHFASAGGFSLAFAPGHYADADLCLRLKRHGLTSLAVPRARFLWNDDDASMSQFPAGLVSRRTFWDSWANGSFSLQSLTTGVAWSMRPKSNAALWPSDGIMPSDFTVTLPSHLQ